MLTEDAHDLDDMVTRACRIAFDEGFADAGQRIIITAGVPLGTPGATNMLRIAYVGQERARQEADGQYRPASAVADSLLQPFQFLQRFLRSLHERVDGKASR